MRKRLIYVILSLWAVLVCAATYGFKNFEAGKEKVSSVTLLPNQGKAQMLSVLIQTAEGKLIVIDGGWEEDGENLYNAICDRGGHIQAWFLTHPHPDHVGALYYILRNKKEDIQIDKIYYSFASPEWYGQVSPADPGMAGLLLDEFSRLPEGVADGSIGKGRKIQVDEVAVTVMNDRYEMERDPINNSDIVYQADIYGKKILFLGDMGYEGGKRLVQEAGGELKSDIVQVAHHGQNGIGKEVYEAIDADTCLWPTPEWLWNNDIGDGPGSGPWDIEETKGWMEELGVKEHFCTKDGEIRLEIKNR